jgi:hypothetical protein
LFAAHRFFIAIDSAIPRFDSPQIIVFDDSTPGESRKVFPLLEKTKTHHDLYSVGRREKEQFLALSERAGCATGGWCHWG